MDIYASERWASLDSPIHRAQPLAKILGVLLGIVGVMLAPSLPPLVAMGLSWLALLAWAQVPMTQILGLAAYPAIFASLYSLINATGWASAFVIVGKAMVAAIAVLGILATTPYFRLFQTLRPALPEPLGDALLLTYRALFLLLERWGRLLIALRLRGGLDLRHFGRSAGHFAQSLGVLLLAAQDRSEATYDAMLLRGYRGILTSRTPLRLSTESLWPLAIGAGGIATALARTLVLPAFALSFLGLGIGWLRKRA